MNKYQLKFNGYGIEYVVWKQGDDELFRKVFSHQSKDECEFYIVKQLGHDVKDYNDYKMVVNRIGFIEDIQLTTDS